MDARESTGAGPASPVPASPSPVFRPRPPVSLSRRGLLALLLGTAAGLLEACSPRPGRPALRLAVASDLHYGQPGVPSDRHLRDLRQALLELGPDLVVLAGDLVHDAPWAYDLLRRELTGQLPCPCLVARGNHDTPDSRPWKALWGHAADHRLCLGGLDLVLADTSVPGDPMACRGPDLDRLAAWLRPRPGRRGIVVVMHAAQAPRTDRGRDLLGISRDHEAAGTACMELLARHPQVRFLLHGHDHRLHGAVPIHGLPCFFAGRCGGSWGGPRGLLAMDLDAWGRVVAWEYRGQGRAGADARG